MKDPYEVLGVPKTASEADIKKAFRTLAKKHHPDKHAGDAAAQKRFQEISGAYDILGDKDKRAQFDAGAIGADGNPRGFDPRQGGGFRQGNPFGAGGFGGSGGGPGAREFHFSFDDAPGGAAGFEDMFADLMGVRRGGRSGGPRNAKGEDFAAAVTVSFDEAAIGGTRRVVLQNGEQIDVKIPVGVKDGQVVRVKGRGGAGRGGPNGDILLTVSVAPHPYMTRDGNDIRMDLPVTLKEAVVGGKVPVPTLTGTVSLTVPPNSNTGTMLRLKGKGIAAPGGAGDLYVRLVILLPDRPDESLRNFAEGWSANYDPRAKMR
jgi:DnaJ-class molecular chaperone